MSSSRFLAKRIERGWSSGWASAFQAEYAGSIPALRSMTPEEIRRAAPECPLYEDLLLALADVVEAAKLNCRSQFSEPALHEALGRLEALEP